MDLRYRDDPSVMMTSAGYHRPDYYNTMALPSRNECPVNDFSFSDGLAWERSPESVNLNMTTRPDVHHLQSGYHETSSNSCSQYTLDMIFHNLIHPDVSEGQCFTFDTLLQSVSDDSFTQGTQYCGYLESQKRGTLSGKRKRSHDSSCDYDSQKRLRNNVQSHYSNLYPQGVAKIDGRRLMVPKRISAIKR